MLKIGLTGGIGSGKTTVSDMFAEFGVPVIDMDVIARQVVAPGSPALKDISRTFGATVFNKDGSLNREALRQQIFESNELRVELEKILHPLIRAETEQQLSRLQASYCIIVIPLLTESKQQSLVDRILVIDAPESLQISRTMRRDNISEQDARKILDSQTDRTTRLQSADDIIENSGDMDTLRLRVGQLHEQYIRVAEKSD